MSSRPGVHAAGSAGEIWTDGAALGQGRLGRSGADQRNGDGYGRSPPRRALDFDFTFVLVHYPGHDRQAETAAAGVAASRLVRPIEAVEHVLQVRLGCVDARISMAVPGYAAAVPEG